MKEFIKRIFEIYKPFRRPMMMVFLFIAVSQALIVVNPYIQGKIVDEVFAKASLGKTCALAVLAFVLFIINSIFSNFFREKFELKNLDFSIPKFVSIKVTLEKIFSFSIGQHHNQNSGVKRSVIDKGENSLAQLTNMILYNVFPMFISLVLTVFAILYLSTVLGLIFLVGTIVFIWISIYLNYLMKDDMKKFQDFSHETNKIHSEIFRNLGMIQINAQEKRVTEKLDQKMIEHGELGRKVWGKYAFWSLTRNIAIGITRLLILSLGIVYVFNNTYTPGQLVMFISLSGNAFGGIGSIGNLHRKGIEYVVAVKKYFSLLDIEPEIKETNNPVEVKNLKGKIVFENVSFRYPARQSLPGDDEDDQKQPECEQETLSEISFTIEPGQKVAFVGPSGTGKTTIANLILRSYDPTKGKIIVDDDDLRVLDLKTFRENIGYVEQEVSLFDDTLRYNMTFGLNGKSPFVTDEKLDEISQASCIDKFFHRLENGFDTIIGERGVKLSGGERQRVGIARALAKNPKILIFDEATSSLDTENETAIRKSIEEASKGRTTIIIAHRLSTVRDADKIIVMENGKIVGQGTHNELLKDCVVYQNLVNNQV